MDADPVAVAWPQPWPEAARQVIEGDAILDVSVPAVAHRDDLTHRLWRSPQPPAPSEQAVYTWRAADAVDDVDAVAATAIEVSGPPEPLPHEHHDITRGLHHHEHGSLDRTGPRTYVYPEWDVVRQTTRPRWCRVVEDAGARADPSAVHDLQRHHQLLVARLRRLMQSAAPRALEFERRTVDGDDIDFDAAVEALVDLRLGRSPGEGVYQRLVPRRRDVVVGIVVDASASTGERLAGVAPLAPVRGPVGYRDHPRVLDIEILATVLCLSAVDAVGDQSVAWAFSGSGRESVRMPVIKTLQEPFGGPVLRRAAAVRPGHSTRTGAAIRHAAAVLAAAPHATRLLLVLTDGQPYDMEYGQQYGDERASEYALADTARAVTDARGSGVRPVLLTVATHGEPLPLADIVPETRVLHDITRLPERLTGLYRDLTRSVQPAAQ
jgi:nitric oxide reductase activation protein